MITKSMQNLSLDRLRMDWRRKRPSVGLGIHVIHNKYDERVFLTLYFFPGKEEKEVGKNLAALGVKILNSDITGKVHRDRTLLTGDSPLASNALSKLAAETLLAEVK